MTGVAGFRGIVGRTLLPEDVLGYALTFMRRLRERRPTRRRDRRVPKLVLGRDTRPSGPLLHHLACAAAVSAGVDVHDLGVVPTPTVGLMTRHLRADGGLALTASHNPIEWNGLKFFSAEGVFLTTAERVKLLNHFQRRGFPRAEPEALGHVRAVRDPIAPHLAALLAVLPTDRIRRRRLRVALDACNGAGRDLALALLDALGVRCRLLHDRPDRAFERPPEPVPPHLGALRRAVVDSQADVGFALDPDGDRLALVDETGRPIGEERTIVLAADYVLPRRRGPLVVNLSTTRAVEDVAARHGVRVHRAPVGEAHVVEAMRRIGAVLGGEGNGGVIFPAVHPGRDAATAIGLTLALLAEAEEARRPTLSALNAAVADYVLLKDRLDLGDREGAGGSLERLRRAAAELRPRPRTDRRDGLKLVWPDRWLHVRPSSTEPILRLFAEAPTRPAAGRLLGWARQRIA